MKNQKKTILMTKLSKAHALNKLIKLLLFFLLSSCCDLLNLAPLNLIAQRHKNAENAKQRTYRNVFTKTLIVVASKYFIIVLTPVLSI